MSTIHTEGPWEYVAGQCNSPKLGDDKCGGIRSKNGWWIAEVNGDCHERSGDEPRANAALIAAAPDLFDALVALTTCKYINLGDLIYRVRESEGEGWDGPAVTHWSNAVQAATAALKRARGEG